MGMVVRTNSNAMNAYRQLGMNNNNVQKSLQKLSSGFRINTAADDAAGLAISEKMKAQIKGLEQASSNSQDGISLVQTAEGATTEIHSMLNRMVELATKSANGTIQDNVDREAIQEEVKALNSEISRITDSTNFNGIQLLDGSLSAKVADAMTATDTTVNLSDGVETVSAANTAAAKETVEVTFDKAFAVGDTVTFNFGGNDIKLTMAATDSGDSASDFGGATLQDQVTKMKGELLNGSSTFTEKYDISTNATNDGLVFTAKDEGPVDVKAFSGVTVDCQDASGADVVTAAVVDSGTPASPSTKGGLNGLLGGTTGGLNLVANDKLDFTFNIEGKDYTVSLEAGKDFDFESKTIAEQTTALTEALGNAHLTDDASTKAMDESRLTINDFFDLKANVKPEDGSVEDGSISINAKDTHGLKASANVLKNGANEVTITRALSGLTEDLSAKVNTATAGKQDTYTDVANTKITMTDKVKEGDSFTISGKLKDGRLFSVDMTAVANDKATLGDNEFKITPEADNATTLGALATALQASDTKVTVEGQEEKIVASELFAADTSKAFKVTSDGTSLTLTTGGSGGDFQLGANGEISAIEFKSAGDVASTTTKVDGKNATKATMDMTFDAAKVEQGTTIDMDGKTYEFVTDVANLTKESNIAVVVDNLGKLDETGTLASDAATSEDIASAFKAKLDESDAVDNQYTSGAGNTYTLATDGAGKLTIESTAEGSAAVALADPSVKSSTERDAASIDFQSVEKVVGDAKEDVLNVKVGDTVKINGKTYEFTDGHRASDENFVQVDVKGLAKNGTEGNVITKDTVANALADAINQEDSGLTAAVNGETGAVDVVAKFDELADAGEELNVEVELGKDMNGLSLQIGDTADEFNKVSVTVDDLSATGLGTDKVDLSTQEAASKSIDTIKSAINKVSTNRANLGALQNRLEHTINNLNTTTENMTAANSRIRDTDMAKEMMDYTKMNVLTQAAQAMLAQANQAPQAVLQLLQ